MNHLHTTPSEPDVTLHRMDHCLVWQPERGRAAPDGQVQMHNALGVETLTLCPQPHKPGKYMGVSMFAPQCSWPVCEAAHAFLGRGTFSCFGSVPSTPLPPQLQLVNDHTFRIKLPGELTPTVVGQHYTLFAAEAMPVSLFEEKYTQLLQTFLPCSLSAQGGKKLSSLIDQRIIPPDRCTAMAVQALESLAETSLDPNTALFATLFALDLRACDTAFEDVLSGCNARAMLVALAMDQYVVRDPLLHCDALDAQGALAVEVPGYQPCPVKCEPFWEVHPLQFRFGPNTHSDCGVDSLYKDQVTMCAPGFAFDRSLQDKVLNVVHKLRQELGNTLFTVDTGNATIEHQGITFTVVVSIDKAPPSGGGGSHGSGGSTYAVSGNTA